MKSIFIFICALAGSVAATAQASNPVTWSFNTRKVGNKLYEVQMIATLQPGWHLYAQIQPKDAIAQPITFTFNKNPFIDFDGKVKEVGKLQKFTDRKLGISANQYSNKVMFLQKIKVKNQAKTNITGKLEYQTCNDEKCLPPKTINLSIPL